MNHTHTTIEVQGNPQEVFEVYADAEREQTIGFVFDEHVAKILPGAVNSYEAMKAALETLKRGITPDLDTDDCRYLWNIAEQALLLAEGKEATP